MARSEITVAEPAVNAVATVTKDAFDAASGHSIDVSNIVSEQIEIFIEKAAADTHTVTILAGDFEDKAAGDLEIELSAIATTSVAIETARFKDNDGLILIDVDGTVSGSIYVAAVPN
jgi:post-segregation antitoxin (ccd killing protein)